MDVDYEDVCKRLNASFRLEGGEVDGRAATLAVADIGGKRIVLAHSFSDMAVDLNRTSLMMLAANKLAIARAWQGEGT